MEKTKGCPHCGSKVRVHINSGMHFYECTNPECRAVISFAGEYIVGIVGGMELCEALNHLERFNKRKNKFNDR